MAALVPKLPAAAPACAPIDPYPWALLADCNAPKPATLERLLPWANWVGIWAFAAWAKDCCCIGLKPAT